MSDPGKTFYEQEIERISRRYMLSQHLYIQLRQSRSLIEQHCEDDIDLEQMAAAAHMSRFHFIRMFKRVYGITPRHYLRDVRIARAKKLLRAGASVTRACLEVGYQSLPTFSNAFKKATGHSPKAYQRLHNGNPG